MTDIFSMLKQAHTLKKEMAKVSDDLSRLEVGGSSRDGLVRVKMDGRMKVRAVDIAPELLKTGDAEKVGRWVVEALEQAREKAQALAAASVKKLTGDIPMPF